MRLTFLKMIITPCPHHVADTVPAQIPHLEMHNDIGLLLALDLVPEALVNVPVDIDHLVALGHPLAHVVIHARIQLLALVLVLVPCHHHEHSHLERDADDIDPQLPRAHAHAHDLARDHLNRIGGGTILLPVVSPAQEHVSDKIIVVNKSTIVKLKVVKCLLECSISYHVLPAPCKLPCWCWTLSSL